MHTWRPKGNAQIYPQSRKGRLEYPPSGGGCNDGGKLPNGTPMVSPTMFPTYMYSM